MIRSARNRSRSVILFLAANPIGNSPLALEEKCAATERELRMTEGRDAATNTNRHASDATILALRSERRATVSP
jgi:hypothetical protein